MAPVVELPLFNNKKKNDVRRVKYFRSFTETIRCWNIWLPLSMIHFEENCTLPLISFQNLFQLHKMLTEDITTSQQEFRSMFLSTYIGLGNKPPLISGMFRWYRSLKLKGMGAQVHYEILKPLWGRIIVVITEEDDCGEDWVGEWTLAQILGK
jgi:hypothetical protein